MLGYLYQSGKGVRKSIANATYLYGLSANQGYDSAQLNLGIIYANLPGDRRDLATAIKL